MPGLGPWWLSTMGCTTTLYDTTVRWGGTVSLHVEPVSGDGIVLDETGPGAPSNQDLGSCLSSILVQASRHRDTPDNASLEICFPAVAMDTPCYADPPEVSFLVLNGLPRLDLWSDANELDVSGDGPADDAFTYEAEGSVSVTIPLAADCLGGTVEHRVEATWAFEQEETYPEGTYHHEPQGLGEM